MSAFDPLRTYIYVLAYDTPEGMGLHMPIINQLRHWRKFAGEVTPRTNVPIGILALSITTLCLATFVTGRGNIFWDPGSISWWSLLFGMSTAGLIWTFAYWPAMGQKSEKGLAKLTVPLLGSFLASLIISRFVIEGFLHSSDEYAYMFQAQTFLAGRLWNSPPPLGTAMTTLYTWIIGDKWVGQYPPGWPSIITFGLALGLPRLLIVPLLALCTALLMNALLRSKVDRAVRIPVVIFMSLTPFTLFNSASLYSHVASSFLVVCTAFACERCLKSGSLRWAFLIGASIGSLASIRYIAAVIIILPVGIALLKSPHRVRLCFTAILGGLPFLVLLLYYHWAITGDPLKPVYYGAGRTSDRLYFDIQSILEGLRQTGIRFWELSLWTSPAFTVAWVIALVVKVRANVLEVGDFIFPAAVLILVFYPIFGGGFGPRYYYEFWPMACYTVATSINYIIDESLRRATARMVTLSMVYALAVLPWISRDFSAITSTRRDLFDQVAEKRLDHAIVCVQSSTGNLLPLRIYDLTRNGINGNGPVLYVDCNKTDLKSISRAYPTRKIWVYERDIAERRGTLAPLRTR